MSEQQESPQTGLIATGYALAVIIPFIGLVLGIVVATRPSKATSRHGWIIIVVSCVAFFAYLVLLLAAANHTATTTYYPCNTSPSGLCSY